MRKIKLILYLFACLTTGCLSQANPAVTSDVLEKVKGLQVKLKLNNTQTSKIIAIYQDAAQEFNRIKVANDGNTDKMLVDLGPFRAITIKKIKAELTPGQVAEYEVITAKANSSNSNGWGGGWSPN